MITLPRLPHILIGSTFALAAFGSAPALSKDAKTTKPDFSAIKGESMDDKHKGLQAADGLCDTHRAQPTSGIASDPEEGGQIAAKKANVGEIKITKPVDTASTKMMVSASPGTGCSTARH